MVSLLTLAAIGIGVFILFSLSKNTALATSIPQINEGFEGVGFTVKTVLGDLSGFRR